MSDSAACNTSSWGDPADAPSGSEGLEAVGIGSDAPSLSSAATGDSFDAGPGGQTTHMHEPAAARRYEVDVTVRETFTMVVEAASAKEARRAVFDPNVPHLDTWAHSDRAMTGVKAVRRAR